MRFARNRYGGWDAIVEAGPVAAGGKRKRRTFSAATQREARARATAYLEQVRAGMERAAEPLTLGEYLYAWLQGKRSDLAPNTWRAYDQHLRLYVVPALGKVRLGALTAADIRGMLAGLEVSQRTRHHALMTLNAALNTAADVDQLIPANPARRLKVSKGRGKTSSLSLEEAERLLAACEAEGSVYADAVAFALLTGLRHGEVLGLRWSDVYSTTSSRDLGRDASASSITIRRALQHVTGQGLVERPPKTEAGERTIALGPRSVAVLSRCKGRQKVVSIGNRSLVGSAGGDVRSGAGREHLRAVETGRLVFEGVKPTALRRHFKILLRQAECPDVRFHDLRHTVATLMRGLLDTKGIAEHLGHADAGITSRLYQHSRPALNAQAVLAYEALFGADGRDTAGLGAEQA